MTTPGSGGLDRGDIPPGLRVRFWRVPRLVWIAARAYLPLPVAVTSLPLVLLVGVMVTAMGGRVIASPGAVLTVQPLPRRWHPGRLLAVVLVVCALIGAIVLLLPWWCCLLVVGVAFLPVLLILGWRIRTRQTRRWEHAAQSAASTFGQAGCRVVMVENLAAWPGKTRRGLSLLAVVVALMKRSRVCTVAVAADQGLAAKYCDELGFERVGDDESRVLARHTRSCPRRGGVGGHTASPGRPEPA